MNKHYSIFNFAALFILLLFVTNSGAWAQSTDERNIIHPKSEQTFRFVYIAQGSEKEMPVNSLINNLETAWLWSHWSETSGPVIYFLSLGNMGEPIIVKANCEADANSEDERNDFNEMLKKLKGNNQYTIHGKDDKKKILELLNEYDIVDSNGQPLYKETSLEFHVGQDFWNSGNNETVLASLFFDLNISRYINAGKNFHFNVFCPRKLDVKNSETIFGFLNPDDCSKYINLERTY